MGRICSLLPIGAYSNRESIGVSNSNSEIQVGFTIVVSRLRTMLSTCKNVGPKKIC